MTDRRQRADWLALGQPERLVLWAMRVWVVGARERIAVDHVLRGSFERAGAPRAPAVLDNIMAVVAGGAARVIDISCICHEGISDDERRILDVIALFQSGDTLETPLILRSLLTSPAAGDCARLIERLAGILADAGLVLEARPASIRRHAIGPRVRSLSDWPGSATVH